MSITVEHTGATAIIVLTGKIDYAAQEEFKNANRQALDTDGANEIVVNFAEAVFLDSSGIRALILLQKEAHASGKSVVLANCNEYLRSIFEIGGFDRVFTFH